MTKQQDIKKDQGWKKLNFKAAAVLHLIVAVIIFSPFFFAKKLLLGSTDNWHHHFPNMIFSLKAFQNHDWGLWNPFIYTGIDFSASAHNFIYYPFNWLIFTFPLENFFFLMTIRMFLEVWLVGVFAFLFFREMFGEPRWAVVPALVYQLNGYMFFSVTTYPALTLYLWLAVAAYIIYALPRWPGWASFVSISLSVAGIILCCNTVYSVAVLFTLALVFLYRYFSYHWQRPGRGRCLLIVIWGVLTGVMLSMIHLLPFVANLVTENRRVAGMGFAATRGGIFLGLSAFVPEVLGISYWDSFSWIGILTNLRSIHSQNSALNYFGALPALLLLWSFFLPRKKELFFWQAMLVTAVLWFLKVSPVSEMLNVLFYPFLHEIVPHVMIPIPLCVIAGFTFRELAQHPRDFTARSAYGVLLSLLFLTLGVLTFYIYVLGPDFSSLKRVARIVSLASAAGFVLIRFLSARVKFSRYPAVGLSTGVAVAVFFIVLGLSERSLHLTGAGYALATTAGVMLLWFVGEGALLPKDKLCKFGTVLAAGLLTGLLLWAPVAGYAGRHPFRVLVLAGYLRLAVITVFLMTLVYQARQGRVRLGMLFTAFIAIVLVDLIPHNKVYSHIVTEPFYKQEDRFPERDTLTSQLDLKNYRVNVGGYFLGVLDKPEYFSNTASLYGVRMFSGVNSEVTPAHESFVGAFMNHDGPLEERSFYLNRGLDLLGCGYDIDRDHNRFFRQRALSRFMFFENFEVISDPTRALARLTEKDFDPGRTLVLEREPGALPSEGKVSAQKLDFIEIKTSEIKLILQSSKPGLVFFGDSFHPDWQAFIDGEQTPVLRADEKFMAVAVPPGYHSLEWRFAPEMFYRGKTLSLWGGVLLIGLALVLFVKGAPQELG